MPLAGKEVTDANEQLADESTIVNEQPLTAGWPSKIRPDQLAERQELLTAGTYDRLTNNP